MDIHGFEKQYIRTIKQVQNVTISEQNKKLILDFNEDLILDYIKKARHISKKPLGKGRHIIESKSGTRICEIFK